MKKTKICVLTFGMISGLGALSLRAEPAPAQTPVLDSLKSVPGASASLVPNQAGEAVPGATAAPLDEKRGNQYSPTLRGTPLQTYAGFTCILGPSRRNNPRGIGGNRIELRRQIDPGTNEVVMRDFLPVFDLVETVLTIPPQSKTLVKGVLCKSVAEKDPRIVQCVSFDPATGWTELNTRTQQSTYLSPSQDSFYHEDATQLQFSYFIGNFQPNPERGSFDRELGVCKVN